MHYFSFCLLKILKKLKTQKPKSCDGSDGKAVDSGLKGPGFNIRPMQEKVKKCCTVFLVEKIKDFHENES